MTEGLQRTASAVTAAAKATDRRSSAGSNDADVDDFDVAPPLHTPYVPFDAMEAGEGWKHAGGHGHGGRAEHFGWWWGRWRMRPPFMRLAAVVVVVVVLAVGLGVGLAGGGGGGKSGGPAPAPAPAPTQPCTGSSAGLIPGDCAAWQRFFNSSGAQRLVTKVRETVSGQGERNR